MSDLDLPLAVRMMQDGYLMEIQDLEEENDKLRKLVRISIMCRNFLCDECPINEHGRCDYEEQAVELGIEVERGK